MWWAFAVSLITIALFFFFDNKQLKNEDLTSIDNLILSENSQYDPGGGKSSPPSIKFKFTNSEREFQFTYEEFQCVNDSTILADFKKGDTVTIKLKKADISNFNNSNWLNKYSKLYGLIKRSKSYLSLDCRNKVSDRRTNAATKASISSAILSLFFALFIFKPKTKYQALGQFPVDPILIVLAVWLIVCITLR